MSAEQNSQPTRRHDPEAETLIDGQRAGAARGEHGLTPGTRMGRYVVLEEIGQGAMGLVFSAYDPELNRKVALKLLRPNQTERKRARSRLLQEAQALAKLAHPNVITVYDVGTIGDRVFVAMELVEGSTLKGWLIEKPRRWEEVLEVFVPAGRGLAAAHAANLVHRDFKPDNVLIGRDGRVRVMDFGLARPVHSDASDDSQPEPFEFDENESAIDEPLLTQTGSIMGTPAYMAPEQHAGKPTDARSDQFSFCVALYQGLYGERPFSGEDTQTLAEQKLAIGVREPAAGANVPGWVRRVVLRGLQPNPADRFASMEALLVELSKDPRAVRRKIAGAAGTVLAMGGTVLGVHYWQKQPNPCLGAADLVAAVWNDARRDSVRAALGAVDRPFVPATVALVTDTLDRYAGGWATLHTEACAATHLRGEQSSRLLDRRNHCLQQRLDELDALATILETTDAATAADAGFAALELAPLSQCGDIETLNAEVEPPQDPAAASAVAELRTELARIKALGATGHVSEAVRAAESAYVAAQAIRIAEGEDYPPIVVEARFRLGVARALAHDTEAADVHLSEASWQGAAVKHDVVAAAAAGALVPVGLALGRPDEGLSWGRHAEAALHRIAMGGRPEARLRLDFGLVQAAIAEQDRARESFAAAQLLLGDDPNHAWWRAAVLRAVADLDLAAGRPADARSRFEDARQTLSATLGENHPDAALAVAGLARVAESEGNPVAARDQLAGAVALVETALGPMAPRLVPLMRQGAGLDARHGNHDAAIAQLRRAYEISRNTWGDHPRVAGALHELGSAYAAAGRLDDARTQTDLALSLWEKTRGASHPDVAYALTSLGQLDLEQGRPKQAVERLERALKLRGGHGLDAQLLAETQFALARALYVVEDRPRGGELAAKGADAFGRGRPPSPDRAAAVERWLASVGEGVARRP